MEMAYRDDAGKDQGAVALVLDLAKAFEGVSLLVVTLGAPEASAV